MKTSSEIDPPPSRIRDKLGARLFFGIVLALGVLAAIFAGRPYLEIVAAVSVGLGAREWYRLIKGSAVSLLLALTATTLALAAFAVFGRAAAPLGPFAMPAAAGLLAAGALAVAVSEAVTRGRPLWGAFGVLYLGAPALALVALRDIDPNGDGDWLIVSLFLVVWAADTGAYVFGKLIGGPKLAPELSPNKTWAGFFGGILAAAVTEGVFTFLIGGAVGAAMGFGAGLSLVAHGGDLFESAVKRHFHIKDSGGLIPGHGGVLDRIDSTLAAALALAILVFMFHFDPLFGASS
jgi:phosphatidate cytidylyltransferase